MNHRPILLAVLLTLTACSSDNPKTAPSTTTSPATAESTKTTSASTTISTTTATTVISSTSTAPVATTGPSTTEPPTTVAAGIGWRAVIQTLGQRRQDLYAAPDVSRIPKVCGGGTPCFEQLNVQLGDLVTKRWRVIGADPYTVLDARVEKFDGDTLDTSLLVTIIAVVQRPATGGKIVDASGAIVASVDAETPEGMNSEGRTILARTGPADDPWRVVSEERLREVPA